MAPASPAAVHSITIPARAVASTAVDAVEQVAGSAPAVRTRGGLSPATLRRVCEYVDTHLDEKISIDDLAEVAGLSSFHFARAFKHSQGVSPHAYIVQRRIERTLQLLAETDLPLSEIALATGFADQSHCARRFREHTGVRPRDYRWSTR